MLDPGDIKLVKKNYLLPKVAWGALAALFPTGALAIFFVMVDNIALGSKGFGDAQMATMVALMALEGAITIACGLSAQLGVRRDRWLRIEREALGANADTKMNPSVVGGAVAAASGRMLQRLGGDGLDKLGRDIEFAGGISASYGFFETMQRMSDAAKAVANAHEIALPRAGRAIALVICLPLLILTLSFIPRFVDSANRMSAARQASAHVMEVLETALAPTSDYTLADDPMASRRDGGYRVSGNITDEEGDVVASIAVKTDESGLVKSVVYNADVDIDRSPEENLAFAEDRFVAFNSAIAQIDLDAADVELADPGLFQSPALPEEFRVAFLDGDYYTDLDADIAHTDTLRAWIVFSTEPREEFDEYSKPRISMHFLAL